MNTRRVFCFLLVALFCVGWQFSAANDSTLTPRDRVPQLSESFELLDYKELCAGGTLLPDRISRDTAAITVGMPETILEGYLPDSSEFVSTTQSRTREQQWQFIRDLLARNNFSMHYYILASIYYDKQLYGWFKEYEWYLDGIGRIRVHLHAPEQQDGYRIWLLQLVLDSIVKDSLMYKQPPGLVLVRTGERPLEWNIDENRVTIGFNR